MCRPRPVLTCLLVLLLALQWGVSAAHCLRRVADRAWPVPDYPICRADDASGAQSKGDAPTWAGGACPACQALGAAGLPPPSPPLMLRLPRLERVAAPHPAGAPPAPARAPPQQPRAPPFAFA
jgi:hypothetical protein